jgi:hypothetical protein
MRLGFKGQREGRGHFARDHAEDWGESEESRELLVDSGGLRLIPGLDWDGEGTQAWSISGASIVGARGERSESYCGVLAGRDSPVSVSLHSCLAPFWSMCDGRRRCCAMQ